ncbi:MAG: hypothetical protein ETSY1_31890 [Candidatus Entotheonella factor]|uniref:Uncharacterized protein n=1 Tax=Entotheonella factor TaxID=1429438 RepID=W4LAL6_ENTF1|nr:MAG: hypothetical protein ETSY1_31890 [Candidatus Entotheonella factor]
MKALPNLIAPWMPGRYVALGTDGYGLGEARHTRPRTYLDGGALYGLAQDGQIKYERVEEAIARLGIDANKVEPARQ